MTDADIIQQAISNVRATSAGVVVDLVTNYAEQCVEFWGEGISLQRVETGLHSITAVALQIQEQMRVLSEANANENLRALRHPNGDISVMDAQGKKIMLIHANQGGRT